MMARLLALLIVVAFAVQPASAAEKSGGDEGPPVLRFIDLPAMSAAVLRSNRVRGLVTVQITIEVLHPEDALEIQGKLPRIRATFLNVVQRYASRLRSTRELLELEAMLDDMQRNADIVVGDGMIRPLIQNISYGN